MFIKPYHGRILAAALLLSACAGGEAPPQAIMSVTARLAPPPAEAVDVTIANVPPGRRIGQLTLIDPEGGRHPAPSLVPVSVAEGGLTTRPLIGIGISGGSSSGIRPSLTLGGNITHTGSDRTSRRVEARVPIPNPTAYRAAARRWRVEVGFTEIGGKVRHLTFPTQTP